MLQLWDREGEEGTPPTGAPSDLLTQLMKQALDSADDPDAYEPSAPAAALWSDLCALRSRIESRTALQAEYSVLSAKQTLSEAHAKTAQLKSVRKVAALNALLGIATGSSSSSSSSSSSESDNSNDRDITNNSNGANHGGYKGEGEDKEDSALADLARQKMRLVDSYEQSMRDQDRRVQGQDIMSFANANALSQDDVDAIREEQAAATSAALARGQTAPAWNPSGEVEDIDNDEEDEVEKEQRASDGIRDGSNPFSFDFDSIDPRAVLEEGETSPEEEYFSQMDRRAADRPLQGGDGDKPKGVEFGLDETALYEQPQQRWRKSGFRETKPGGKGTGKSWRRYEDRKRSDEGGSGDIEVWEGYEGEDMK